MIGYPSSPQIDASGTSAFHAHPQRTITLDIQQDCSILSISSIEYNAHAFRPFIQSTGDLGKIARDIVRTRIFEIDHHAHGKPPSPHLPPLHKQRQQQRREEQRGNQSSPHFTRTFRVEVESGTVPGSMNTAVDFALKAANSRRKCENT